MDGALVGASSLWVVYICKGLLDTLEKTGQVSRFYIQTHVLIFAFNSISSFMCKRTRLQGTACLLVRHGCTLGNELRGRMHPRGTFCLLTNHS
jgi:hypothetical protein